MPLSWSSWGCVHRKCEQKVVTDCSARLERAVLQHDKQKSAVTEEEGNREEVSGVDRCGECVGEGRYLLARSTAHEVVSEPDPQKIEKEGLVNWLGWKYTLRPECRRTSDWLLISILMCVN